MSGIDKYYENDQGRQPLGNWQGMKERRNTVVSYFFSSMHPISFNIWCTLMWQLIKITTNTTLLHIINLHQRSGSCLKSKAWWDNFAQIADNLHQFVFVAIKSPKHMLMLMCNVFSCRSHCSLSLYYLYLSIIFIYIRAGVVFFIHETLWFLWSVKVSPVALTSELCLQHFHSAVPEQRACC